jgi:membrane-associated phospholipid phosphatase
MNIIDEFGYHGLNFLIILSMYLLWNNNNMFFFYIIGIICDLILNIVLKSIIQQPRPNFDSKQLQLALKNNKRYIYKDGIPYDLFGMPSRHASTAFFSTIFVYLALRQTNWLYVYLIIDAMIMYQRVTSNDHSISQIIVGAFVGACLAYVVYQFAENKIKGHIREKPDDFGPI